MKCPMPLHRNLCFLDVGHGNNTVIIAAEENVVDTVRQSLLPEFFLSRESRNI